MKVKNSKNLAVIAVLALTVLIENVALAEDYCTDQGCEPGVVATYTCSGNTGSGGNQGCGYNPVMTTQCGDQGCYNAPAQNIEQCESLGISNCVIRPKDNRGNSPTKPSTQNEEEQLNSNEYTYECNMGSSSDTLLLSISSAKIKIITAKGISYIKNLYVEQLSPTYHPELSQFTTLYKDKAGKIIFKIEDYNFDSPNGFGSAQLKKYQQMKCRK